MAASVLLDKLGKAVDELRCTTSLNEKLKILSRHQDIHPFLKFLYEAGPFNLTSAGLKKTIDSKVKVEQSYEHVEDIIRDLEMRSITGHEAILAYQDFIKKHTGHEELLKCILDRDFRIRLGPKSIIKAIDSQQVRIPSFALAKSMDDESTAAFFTKSLANSEKWFGSRKLDGVRCVALVDLVNQKIRLISRQGKDLSRLPLGQKLLKELGHLDMKSPLVLDGEICCFEGNKDNFSMANSIIMKAVRNTNGAEVAEDALSFQIFDMLSEEEFYNNVPSRPFGERFSGITNLKFTSREFSVVEQCEIAELADLNRLRETARSNHWEGVMLRRADSPYKGKRTNDLVKCKDFCDAEFKVVGFNTSRMRVVDGGMEREEELLASLDVEFKGNIVSVGSGFSLDERRQLLKEGPALIGRLVTICYFQESSNKANGKASLRFPIFKSLYSPI